MEILPTEEAVTAVRRLIDQYKPETVIGHREVVHNGKPVDTKCPGDTWGEVKKRLLVVTTSL